GTHRETEIVGEARDTRIFHAGFGLELVSRDHWARVDLDDLSAHIELAAFFNEDFGLFAQFFFTDGLRTFPGMEKGAGGQLEAAYIFRSDGDGAQIGIGAVVDGVGFETSPDASSQMLFLRAGGTIDISSLCCTISSRCA